MLISTNEKNKEVMSNKDWKNIKGRAVGFNYFEKQKF